MHGSMTSVKKGLVARASRASPLFFPLGLQPWLGRSGSMCTGRKIFVCVSCFTRATGIYIYVLFFWKLFPSVTLKDGMAGEKEKDAESYIPM
jgi:hypothetical protein